MNELAALGRRIQKLRRKVGLSQEQLAEKADLSLKHLGEVERGRGNPTFSSLVGLAAALGITLSELCDFQHEQQSADAIKREVHTIIDEAEEDDSRTYYRVLKALTK